MQGQVRIVIVGGGMMGSALLYHLAAEGITDALLVEKGELTSGSTWHAAGQCPSFIADYNMAKIHDYGNRLYPRLESITGQYVGWHGAGGIRFATRPEEVEWFHRVAAIGALVGFHCEIIDPAKIRQLNPFVNTDGVLAGAWTTDDGHVDPATCCQALARGARDLGATIVTRNRVLGIHQRPSGDWQVDTEQGSVICETVVNAAGCYAREVSRMVGTDVPITNMMHTYLVTDTVAEFAARDEEMPVMRDPYPSAYYRQEQKSGLIGIYETRGSMECWTHRGGWPEWEAENELFDPDFDVLAPYLERVMERMPIWRDLGIKRVVCGAIPHTPDGNPLLGPAAGLRNFWHCNGASIGIAAGAGCGKYLAQWMVHGDAEINMAGLDPRRFGSHAPGEYTRAKSHQDYEHMYALHLPGEERPASRPARTSSLYPHLEAAGAVHTEANGWERPKWFRRDGREEQPGFRRSNVFEVVAAECRAVRESVGVLDLSSFAKYELRGTGAGACLDRLFANRMPRRDGGIVLAHALSDNGRILGESTVTRLAADHYYVLSGATAEDRDLDTLRQALDDRSVTVDNVTDHLGVLVVAGPNSRAVLAPLTETDLASSSFPWLCGRQITLAGLSVRALRVTYVGELGYELHCAMDHLPALYEAIVDAGTGHGMTDFGVYAVNSLRMEKAYKGWGSELTNEITLVEADMMRFFAADKGDFRGREATLAAADGKDAGIRCVYLELDADGVDIAGGEPVRHEDDPVGITTSGAFGHATGRSLGFAYVPTALAAAGQQLEVELLGDRRAATVLAAPVYDPANEQLRA